MIPLCLHQIWIGPLPQPLVWMQTWLEMNPHIKYKLWTDYEGFRYQDKIKRFVNEKRFAIAADIMRVEILYEHGGVYIDADSICLESIEDAPFMDSSFFACHDYTEWVANGVMGSTPKNPIMKDYLERMENAKEYWEFGARMLTKCLEGREAVILPTCAFYPTNYNGKKAPVEGKIYAKHIWGTTRGKYV